MTPQEMDKDPANRVKTSTSEVVCDPCQTSATAGSSKPIGLLGVGNRSDVCWSAEHSSFECKYAWCNCWCHKQESNGQRVTRATAHNPNPKPTNVGEVLTRDTDHNRILVVQESGPPRWMQWLPSGELAEYVDDSLYDMFLP